jgi:O-succinylhomoserine sulfhydrylase
MTDKPLPPGLHPDTIAVRTAVGRSQYGENSEALYLTSGYVQPTAEAAARRFAGDEEGFTYGRYGNPTVSSFEQRLASMEGNGTTGQGHVHGARQRIAGQLQFHFKHKSCM